MRVLHILSSDDQYGSAKSFLELLGKEIRLHDVEPYVVIPCENKIAEFCKRNKIEFLAVDYEQFQIPKHDNTLIFALKYTFHFLNYCVKNQKAMRKIRKFALDKKIDVIHTNSSVIDLGAELHNELEIPHVWHLREFGKEDFNFYSLKKNTIRYMNCNTDQFLCISEAMKNSWIEKGIDKNKIVVICHGVDANKFTEKAKVTSAIKINGVMCGSFSKGKGQHILIEALNQLNEVEKSNIHVDFYGKAEGNYYEECMKKIDEYNLQKVVSIKGFTSNINEKLTKYNVGFNCSKAEAMGRVTIEYMMSGLCPVVSKSGANIEIVGDNNCGLLYESGKTGLVEVLRYLINDPSVVLEYAQRSSKIAKEKYDANKNIDKIIEVFLKQCTVSKYKL